MLMAQDEAKKAEADARAEASRRQRREELLATSGGLLLGLGLDIPDTAQEKLWLNLQPEEFRLRGYLSRHSRSAFSTTSLLGSTRGKYSLSPVCKPTRIEK
jgi:hypothetical protein